MINSWAVAHIVTPARGARNIVAMWASPSTFGLTPCIAAFRQVQSAIAAFTASTFAEQASCDEIVCQEDHQGGTPMKAPLMTLVLVLAPAGWCSAASGEMRDGTPQFDVYSAATGAHVVVWALSNATVAFPSGGTSLLLTPATMGMDSFKIAIATLTAARVSGLRVRFFAHGERDGGCGVNYVELTG